MMDKLKNNIKDTAQFVNKIIQGDCLEVLRTMPDECIDMIITSPPYYGLRKYGDYKEQIGLEPTFAEYMNKMIAIMKELKRVLKPSGQMWINMGDCYTTHQSGGKNSKHNFRSPELSQKVGHTLNKPSGVEKCLLMMPERFAIRCIDELGLILRNKIKWAKQVYLFKDKITKGSVMPTSVKDRFNESGEELYFFVKNKKYYSDLNAVRLPNQVIGISDFRNTSPTLRAEESYPNAKILNVPRPFNYRVRDAKRKEGQPQFKASEEEIKNYGKKSLEARMDDTKNKDQKSSRTYNMKKLLSEVRLGIKPNTGMERNAHIGMKSAPQPNEPNAFHPLGKNLPTVWLIGSEPHNFQREYGSETDHFATFPQALCNIPIRFGCPKDGIVLDPFAGSGTALVVAKKLGRNYLGIELNKEYIEIAEKRIAAIPPNLFQNSQNNEK